MIEGLTWIVERPRPENYIIVTDVAACEDGGTGDITVLDLTAPDDACDYLTTVAEELIRIEGLHPCDYLTAADASALAAVLTAAVNEKTSH
jgi:hypothetical protein